MTSMAATVWKGYLTFGMISVPIRLFVAARDERVSFNQLHRPCGSRIKQQIYCPVCDRVVERSELAKGYEFAKDRYLIVEEQELDKIAPPSSHTMEILQFVKLQDVDPLYYNVSYYAVPEDPGRKPYQLLVEAMQKTGYAALAKVAMHQREYVVLIRPRASGLTLHTMYYPDEVRQVAEYGQAGGIELKPQEVALAEQLVETLAGPFQPQQFRDEYQHKVKELLQAKQEGQEVPETEPKRMAPVIDLMEALQKSLAAVPKKPPVREAAEAESAAEAAPQRAVRRGRRP
jgi:DNA end-binding protein Ku